MNSHPSSVSTRSMVFDGGGAPATTTRTRPRPGTATPVWRRAAAASSTAAMTAGAQVNRGTPSDSTRRRNSSPASVRRMTWRTPTPVVAAPGDAPALPYPGPAAREGRGVGGDECPAIVLGDPELVQGHGQAPRHVGELRIGDAAQAAARRVGLVRHGLAVAIHELR